MVDSSDLANRLGIKVVQHVVVKSVFGSTLGAIGWVLGHVATLLTAAAGLAADAIAFLGLAVVVYLVLDAVKVVEKKRQRAGAAFVGSAILACII